MNNASKKRQDIYSAIAASKLIFSSSFSVKSSEKSNAKLVNCFSADASIIIVQASLQPTSKFGHFGVPL